MTQESKSSQAYAALIAGAVALNVFWIANICKEAYPGVKNLLNFYPAVGPLLGLFVLGLVTFAIVLVFVSTLAANHLGGKGKKTIVALYIVSTVLFLLMVFPPVFEPIVGFLSKK